MTHLSRDRLLELSAGAALPEVLECAHLEMCRDCDAALSDERDLCCCIAAELPRVEPPPDFVARLCCAFDRAVASRRARAHALELLGLALLATLLVAGGLFVLTKLAHPLAATVALVVKEALLVAHVVAVVGGSLPALPIAAASLTALSLCCAAVMMVHLLRLAPARVAVK